MNISHPYFNVLHRESENYSNAYNGETEYFSNTIVRVLDELIYTLWWSQHTEKCLFESYILPSLLIFLFNGLSPSHASCKGMKLCQGAIFYFTVQYKAINKTASITVNNTSNMTNATLKCSQHTPRDSPPSLSADELLSANKTVTSTVRRKTLCDAP